MNDRSTVEYRTTRTFLLIPLGVLGFLLALTAWVILGGVGAGASSTGRSSLSARLSSAAS